MGILDGLPEINTGKRRSKRKYHESESSPEGKYIVVRESPPLKCPACGSEKVKITGTKRDLTPKKQVIKRHRLCLDCGLSFISIPFQGK